MSSSPRRGRAPRINLISPQLFALGLLIETEGIDHGFLREKLETAIVSADRILSDEAQTTAGNKAIELLLNQLRAVKRMATDNAIDRENLTFESLDAGLWLGMALSYRFFAGGAR